MAKKLKFKVGDRVEFVDNYDGVSGTAKVLGVSYNGVIIDARNSDGSPRFLRLGADWITKDFCALVATTVTIPDTNPFPGQSGPVYAGSGLTAANPNRMQYDNSSQRRKEQPTFSGFVRYFPAAMALVSELSRLGNEKHNPGEPLHHARGKSMDHGDCILRHQATFTELDEETGLAHAVAVAWRAMAQLQELAEKEYGWPMAPGAKGEKK